jgi:hypothetical protein
VPIQLNASGIRLRLAGMTLLRALTNIALAVLFALAYLICYVFFLNHWFDYAGFAMYHREISFLCLSTALAVLPIVCYRGVRAISSVISIFVYVLLYVPIILTFALASSRPVAEIIIVQMVLACCMGILFLGDALVVRNPVDLHSHVDLVFCALVLTVVGALYILFVYRSNLRFVSFGVDLYTQRLENVSLGAGLITRYLTSWLTNVLIPICLAYGLVAKKYNYFVVGTGASAILYMAIAAKIVVLLPLIYLIFYLAFGEHKLNSMYSLFTGGLTVTLLALLAVTKEAGGLVFFASSLIINRVIGNAGQLTLAYYDFFSFYPVTNYTHVNGIKQLTSAYPYGPRSLGEVIGQFYSGPETDANANFWATDGFAALGTPGLLIATLACLCLLMLMNSVTRPYKLIFVVLCFIPFIVQLLNTSLFTSVWSGGALFLLLFFLFNTRSAAAIRVAESASLA